MPNIQKTIDKLQYSNTVLNKITENRPYINSKLIVKEIISSVKPTQDTVVNTWLRWDVPGTFNGSNGIWELVLDPKNNTIYHFVYKSIK